MQPKIVTACHLIAPYAYFAHSLQFLRLNHGHYKPAYLLAK